MSEANVRKENLSEASIKLQDLISYIIVLADKLDDSSLLDQKSFIELFDALESICRLYNFKPRLSSQRYISLNYASSIQNFKAEIHNDMFPDYISLSNSLCLLAHIGLLKYKLSE